MRIRGLSIWLIVILLSMLMQSVYCVNLLASEIDQLPPPEINATVTGESSNRTKDSFADMIDRALEKEFTENDEDQTGGLF